MDLFDELIHAGFDMHKPVAIIRMLPSHYDDRIGTFIDATIGIINCGVIIAPESQDGLFEPSTYVLLVSTGLPGPHGIKRIAIDAHSTIHHNDTELYIECNRVRTYFSQDEESIQSACEIKVALAV